MSQENVTWKMLNGQLQAFVDGTPVTWFPQPGSQEAFLRCPIFEAILGGNRGGGKTDVLIMDFCQHVGKGFGEEWQGVLFRRTFPELDDVIKKCLKWIKKIWPEADYNTQNHVWKWPTGEQLQLRHIQRESDYWSYHGHAYPWIGFEELTTWPDPDCYTRMFSCCRSSHAAVARMARIRSTTNPYGPGHNWVKKRFRLPIAPGKIIGPVIRDSRNKHGDIEPPRVAIRSSLYENKILLIADPNYINRIRAAARNKAELDAWIEGAWDITCGGMFDDIWTDQIHVIPNIPYDRLRNSGWLLNRAYDHGQTKPFACGWWAESNGEPIEYEDRIIGEVPGDLILFDEYYGWNGEDNEGVNMAASEIAEGIIQREMEMGLYGRIKRGPADSAIFSKMDGKKTVAGEMRKAGLYWDDVDKSAGSRKQGWERMREFLKGAVPTVSGIREKPGMFVAERCTQFRRTVPSLTRNDNDLDDIAKTAEDHDADMARYRLRWTQHVTRRRKW